MHSLKKRRDKMPHAGIVSSVSIARLVRTRGDRRIVETDITTVSSIAIYIAINIEKKYRYRYRPTSTRGFTTQVRRAKTGQEEHLL